MILFVSFLVVGCMTALGWYLMRDLFSPYVIVPGVWFAILLLSYLTQPEFFPIIHDFPVAMVLWCGFFLIAAYLVYALLPEERGLLTLKPSMVENVTPSRKVINAYMIISLLAMPYMLYALVRYGIERGETNLFLYIRLSSVETDFDKPEFGLAIYLIPIVPVLLILAYGYVKERWFRILAVLIGIVSGLTTMSKTTFFVMVITILYIQYRRGKVKVGTMVAVFALFVVFSVWFQLMRSFENDVDTFSPTDMLSVYTLSPCVAFDYYAQPMSSQFLGEHVFRFFYAVAHAFGNDIEPASNILKFVGVPELTNTYTILYPFYIDFGLGGIAVFGALYGLMFGFLYRRGQKRDNIYFVLYACFLNYLVLQFVQENFFSNLSLSLQYIAISILPFLVGGRCEGKKQDQT